jgi:hypothetical protein
LTKGYWPPRDPTDPATWGAAFVQGGAAGIYGDYLFGRVDRFGHGPLETLLGPTVGAGSGLVNLILKARDASISEDEQVKLADWINYATQNTPYVNLFWVRPALDYLFLNSLREVATPGFIRKTESKRLSQYGQRNMVQPLRPFQ